MSQERTGAGPVSRFDLAGLFLLCSHAVSPFNITPRRRRSVILATPLAELPDCALVLDCLTPGCSGERTVLVRDLAGVYGRQQTLAEALQRFRCQGCGQRPVGAAWLLSAAIGRRLRVARLALIGSDAVRG